MDDQSTSAFDQIWRRIAEEPHGDILPLIYEAVRTAAAVGNRTAQLASTVAYVDLIEARYGGETVQALLLAAEQILNQYRDEITLPRFEDILTTVTYRPDGSVTVEHDAQSKALLDTDGYAHWKEQVDWLKQKYRSP